MQMLKNEVVCAPKVILASRHRSDTAVPHVKKVDGFKIYVFLKLTLDKRLHLKVVQYHIIFLPIFDIPRP